MPLQPGQNPPQEGLVNPEFHLVAIRDSLGRDTGARKFVAQIQGEYLCEIPITDISKAVFGMTGVVNTSVAPDFGQGGLTQNVSTQNVSTPKLAPPAVNPHK